MGKIWPRNVNYDFSAAFSCFFIFLFSTSQAIVWEQHPQMTCFVSSETLSIYSINQSITRMATASIDFPSIILILFLWLICTDYSHTNVLPMNTRESSVAFSHACLKFTCISDSAPLQQWLALPPLGITGLTTEQPIYLLAICLHINRWITVRYRRNATAIGYLYLMPR